MNKGLNFLDKILHGKVREDVSIIREEMQLIGKWVKSHFTVHAIEDYIGGMVLGLVLGVIVAVMGSSLFGLILFMLLLK